MAGFRKRVGFAMFLLAAQSGLGQERAALYNSLVAYTVS